MFVGQFEHALDSKGRVVLPAAIREELGESGYLAKAEDGCLALTTVEVFEREALEMQDKVARGLLDRAALRVRAAAAVKVKPDAQGRIAVPQELRGYAGLERDVVIIGAFTRAELWDRSRWDAQIDRGEAVLTSGSVA